MEHGVYGGGGRRERRGCVTVKRRHAWSQGVSVLRTRYGKADNFSSLHAVGKHFCLASRRAIPLGLNRVGGVLRAELIKGRASTLSRLPSLPICLPRRVISSSRASTCLSRRTLSSSMPDREIDACSSLDRRVSTRSERRASWTKKTRRMRQRGTDLLGCICLW